MLGISCVIQTRYSLCNTTSGGRSMSKTTTASLAAPDIHRTQVFPAEGINLGSEIVDRRHVRAPRLSFKQRSESVHGAKGAGVPFVDPNLNHVAIRGVIFDSGLHQRTAPLPMPLAIFVERIEHLSQQVIALSQRQVAR